MDNKDRVIFRQSAGNKDKSRRWYFNNCDGWSRNPKAAKRFRSYGQAMMVLTDLEDYVDGVRIGRVVSE